MSQTLSIAFETTRFAEIFAFAFAGFALSMALTPIYTTLAYKYMWWKKPDTAKKSAKKIDAKVDIKRSIPTMAGVIFLLSVTLLTLTSNLSREQTWVPLAAFFAAGLVGLFDDYLSLKGVSKSAARFFTKLKLITAIALVCSWYLYAKLDIESINVPFGGDMMLGWLIVPFFAIVIIASANAVNISDGLDGLAGGLAASAFGAYTVIAFINGQYGVAALCMTIVGALLSYTWFNVFPSRFFMGNVGSFSLGTTLAVVAILTDTVLLLPIIGLIFVTEGGSALLQMASKKLRRGKTIFQAMPIHCHLQAVGWEDTKVTMRFWILGQIAGCAGLLVYLLGVYKL